MTLRRIPVKLKRKLLKEDVLWSDITPEHRVMLGDSHQRGHMDWQDCF
jgi:hypothetical protein